MKARTVSREITLLLLFQVDDKEQIQALLGESFRDQVLETVRSMTSMAQEEILSSAKAISTILYELEDYEMAHPDNAKLKMHEPVKPVTLPTTQDLRNKLTSLLKGLENFNEALDLPEILYFASREEVQNYIRMLLKTIMRHRGDIDKRIDEASEQWSVGRMQKMDLNLLRIGVAELCYTEQADPASIIDDILNLAQRFTEEESRRFIHGILSNVLQQQQEQEVVS